MNELNIRYEDYKGKYIFCLRTENTYGVRKGKGYKIISVDEKYGNYFFTISTEKYPDGIGFNPYKNLINPMFLNVEESQSKLRSLKFERILGGTEDQTYMTDE